MAVFVKDVDGEVHSFYYELAPDDPSVPFDGTRVSVIANVGWLIVAEVERLSGDLDEVVRRRILWACPRERVRSWWEGPPNSGSTDGEVATLFDGNSYRPVTPTEAGLLAAMPSPLDACPACGARPFIPFMRGQVHRDLFSPWRALLRLLGKDRARSCLICWHCKEIVGYERAPKVTDHILTQQD